VTHRASQNLYRQRSVLHRTRTPFMRCGRHRWPVGRTEEDLHRIASPTPTPCAHTPARRGATRQDRRSADHAAAAAGCLALPPPHHTPVFHPPDTSRCRIFFCLQRKLRVIWATVVKELGVAVYSPKGIEPDQACTEVRILSMSSETWSISSLTQPNPI